MEFRLAAPRPAPPRVISRRRVASRCLAPASSGVSIRESSHDRRALLDSAKSAAVSHDRRHCCAVGARNLPRARPSDEGRPSHDEPSRTSLLRATAPTATRLEIGVEIGYVSDSQPERARRKPSTLRFQLRPLSDGCGALRKANFRDRSFAAM